MIIVLAFSKIAAQDLPQEMYYSPDGKTLFTGGQAPDGMYDRTVVRNVYLNFTQANYWTLLTNNYATETEIPAEMIVDGISYPNVGVRFRGNTSYTMIGSSQKKSFAIDTEFTTEDQNVMGYKNFKFNNAHQDASFMREVLYCRMARKYIPIAKANYIHLYLNNQDWGIYPNIQSLDKTYLEQWFQSNNGARFRATSEETGGGPMGGWGDGTAGLNYISADTLTYKNYYSLKSSDISYPWQKLVEACQVLGTTNTANWATTTKNKIDVDRALWFLAAENIFTDDDSYVMKGKMDYYAYYEPETDRLTPLEYDGNSTFESAANSWSPFKNVTNANYPLLNKLLNIPELRQRYLAHYRTILSETFTTANANAIIDEMNTQIAALVAADPKKLYTTAQYTSGVPALKTIIANRRTFLMNNAEVTQIAPIIASATYFNASMAEAIPFADEVANIQTTVSHASGLNKVNLYYATGLLGNFAITPMFDDGAHNDGAASDGIYGGQIPGYAANTLVRYYIEAIANNATLSAAYLPVGAEHDIFVYTVQETIATNGVAINEILSSNTADATDEASDHEDWVELYNNNDFEVDLSGFYLSDDTTDLDKWQFPTGSLIAAGGYMIVWADNEAAEGPLHAAWKISVSGESLTLSDASLNVVDQVIFGAQQLDMGFARIPNGTGDFVIQASTFGADNEIPLATATFIKADGFAIYPNPASNLVNISVTSNLVGKTATLYNAIGQKVYETVLSEQTQIQTNAFSKGVYLIKIGNDSKKLIIK